MPALGQPRELLLPHLTAQAPTLRKLALPLAAHTLALRVVILPRVRELLLVVRLSLARANRFGYGDHTFLLEVNALSFDWFQFHLLHGNPLLLWRRSLHRDPHMLLQL